MLSRYRLLVLSRYRLLVLSRYRLLVLSRYRLLVLSRLLSVGAGQAILTIRLFTGTYSNDSNIIVSGNNIFEAPYVRLYISSSIYYPFRLYYRTFGLYTFTLLLLSLRIYCYLHVPVILLRTHFLYTQLCVSLPQNTGLHYILNKKNDNVN